MLSSFKGGCFNKACASTLSRLCARQFHSSEPSLFSANYVSKSEDKKAILSEVTLEPKQIATLQIKDWLQGEGSAYKEAKMGETNFLKNRCPFPANPYFQPKPPMSDLLKNRIYKDYLFNPRINTPRVLGGKYKTSIKRIEAILKLKAIENQQESNGKVLQKKFNKGMEGMLGVITNLNVNQFEPISTPTYKVGDPLVRSVTEFEGFTSKDAAEVLGRKNFEDVCEKIDTSKFYEINYPGLDPKFAPRDPNKYAKKSVDPKAYPEKQQTPSVLEKNPVLGNKRFDFVFVDTSKGVDFDKKTVLVRKKDGSLVKADEPERHRRIRKVWHTARHFM
ncbi:hypothetical protein BB561_000619 [Smittium simulii]|uniref:37S ribosomal protein S35, mitochondrial n=1 Tax=Smittium simulii TaxID=133385 RepID=A0A2T9YY75_9FUNG|nr:hypothetical protein BB561_000619 [Smittium simulii]